MSLPKGYIKGITRVSDLVSFRYPFEGTDAQSRYKQWLKDNGIDEKEYIKEACDVGTFIHLQMEHQVLNNPLDEKDKLFKKHKNEIKNGLQWMVDSELSNMKTEVYCRDPHNRYQGSIDLLAEIDGKNVLIDWKTWGIAKKRWNLPNGKTKPYDKLKKVALQMSLYAKALGNIDEIWVVWLHEEGYFVYQLDMVSNKELEKLICDFTGEEHPLIITENNMEIEILEPTKQYGNVKVRVNLAELDNGMTAKETMEDAINTVKYLAKEMKD